MPAELRHYHAVDGPRPRGPGVFCDRRRCDVTGRQPSDNRAIRWNHFPETKTLSKSLIIALCQNQFTAKRYSMHFLFSSLLIIAGKMWQIFLNFVLNSFRCQSHAVFAMRFQFCLYKFSCNAIDKTSPKSNYCVFQSSCQRCKERGS